MHTRVKKAIIKITFLIISEVESPFEGKKEAKNPFFFKVFSVFSDLLVSIFCSFVFWDSDSPLSSKKSVILPTL